MEDVEVPSNGQIPVVLMMHHNSSSGYTDFYWDCLTLHADTLTEDIDGDGIYDLDDVCPYTPSGDTVDINGCSSSLQDLDRKCLSTKIKAASKLCSSYMGCYAKAIKKQDLDISHSLAKAESKFESMLIKAELRAAKKQCDCATSEVNIIEDCIVLGVEDVNSNISNGLDSADKNARNLGKALMKISGKLTGGLLKIESKIISKPFISPEKRLALRQKAFDKFTKNWAKAVARAIKKKVVPSDLNMENTRNFIDSFAGDIVSEILYGNPDIGNENFDGRVGIVINDTERIDAYPTLTSNVANEGYDYFVIDLTINQITGGHMFTKLNDIVNGSSLFDDTGNLIDDISRNVGFTGVSFSDPTDITSPSEFITGTNGILLFEIQEDVNPLTLEFNYVFGEFWRDYDAPDSHQIIVGVE